MFGGSEALERPPTGVCAAQSTQTLNKKLNIFIQTVFLLNVYIICFNWLAFANHFVIYLSVKGAIELNLLTHLLYL